MTAEDQVSEAILPGWDGVCWDKEAGSPFWRAVRGTESVVFSGLFVVFVFAQETAKAIGRAKSLVPTV
jgi:hypothetical protein